MSVPWPPIFLFLSLVVDRGEGRRLFVFPPTHPSILLFRLSRISLFDLARQYTPDGMKARRGRQSKDSLSSHTTRLPPSPFFPSCSLHEIKNGFPYTMEKDPQFLPVIAQTRTRSL